MIPSARITGIHLGHMGHFNSQLSTHVASGSSNVDLTIHLRIHFVQESSGTVHDGVGTAYQASEWTRADWDNFKRTVIGNAQRFWNGKFWLTPPANYYGLYAESTQPPIAQNFESGTRPRHLQFYELRHSATTHGMPLFSYRCNVYCKLVIHDVETSPHLTIRVANTASGAFRDSYTHYGRASSTGVVSYSSRHRPGSTLTQTPYIHEIGHAIGQEHIGVTTHDSLCRASEPDGEHCYIGNNFEEESNIMGSGMSLSILNANSWQHAMFRHTGIPAEQWTASLHRIYPRYLGVASIVRYRAVEIIPA